VYGLRPIFLFVKPALPTTYRWLDSAGEARTPVWLRVDVRGIRLMADLWQLREATHASPCADGLWWNLPSAFGAPDPAAAPELLVPYLTEGVATFPALFNEAAEAAITVSGSAAVLEPIGPDRISQL
jgi:hypothetical protein